MKNVKYVVSKERFLKLQKEFRDSFKDKNKQPQLVEFGNYKYRKEGEFGLLTFMFYAIIRGTDPSRACHSVESDTYKEVVLFLKKAAGNCHLTWSENYKYDNEMSKLKKVFTSLTEEEIFLVSKFANENL